jgi:hypothetical protein
MIRTRRVIQFALAMLILASYMSNANAQNFQNGDLNGAAIDISSLPTFWQNIPYTDVNCQANEIGFDTPDVTGLTGPDSINGIIGNPYSNSTFVSGIHGGDQNTSFYHEGIMQSVSGLTIGQEYSIHFYQSVVKQSNLLDTSGSWSVFIDNTLAGTTTPTYSSAAYNSTSFIWEEKNIEFIATSTSHQIKFLPVDDDSNYESSLIDNNGGLRMGIDDISLNILTNIKETQDYSDIISIYPNPFTIQTNIIFKSEQKNATIKIIDLLGNVIKAISFTGSQLVIDKAEIKSGIYFVQTIDDQRQIINNKIIIH